MKFPDLQPFIKYVHESAAHECGHMTVLFKAGTLVALNFLPHETAADGVEGVLETDTGRELCKEDCVALAASMIGELICLGECDSKRFADDRKLVQLLVGQPLENFALGAYEVIKQNLIFFGMLYVEVRKKMIKVLGPLLLSLSDEDYAKLDDKITIFTLAEVQEVHKRAESELARFPGRH
jgi:hypothetical protein